MKYQRSTRKLEGDVVNKFAAGVLPELEKVSSFLLSAYNANHYQGLQETQDVENEADVHVASLWVDFLRSKFPEFNVDTEEDIGKINKGSAYTVRIDSIDGSKHFRSGIPIFSSNISLHLEDKVLFGACVFPAQQELYFAIRGHGAYRNKRSIHVSNVAVISKGFLSCEGPTSKLARDDLTEFHRRLAVQELLIQRSFRVRDLGLGGFGLCHVSDGGFVGYVDLSNTTKVYDLAAALLILMEAGGEITSLPDSQIIIGSNSRVHQELLDIINSVG